MRTFTAGTALPGSDLAASDLADLAFVTPLALDFGAPAETFATLGTALLTSSHAGRVSGQLDPAGQVSWSYDHGTLSVHAGSGFLATQTGDGGFDLKVRADGSFTLRFDEAEGRQGSDAQAVFRYRAGDAVTVPTAPAGNSVVDATADGKVFFDAS